jgi:uncharacterized protein involved in response to NO
MTEQNQTSHYDVYPEGEVSPLLAYAFRPFFILLPAYIALSIILWGLVWSGQIELFMDNVLVWHIYEMMFGVASAGIIGFILTGVPEFYDGVKPVIGKTLLGLVTLWVVGRLAFWMIDWLGVIFVSLTNLPLLIWVTLLIAKPIFIDPLRRNVSLALIFIGIILIQGWFFISMAGWVETDTMRILKLALGAFMVLELLALRRINTGAINEWLENRNIDDTFIARPPRYNVAILAVILFSIFEFIIPNNPILGWLGLAAAAAILNTLNDFFMDEASIVFKSYILPLFLILVLMATGYGLMGFDYLNDGLYGINHFRHFLTTGVFGLSFFMVMVIVGTIHTGRVLTTNRWVDFSVVLIIISTLLRSLIPFVPEYTHWLYLSSAILWAIPFIIYLVIFYPFLSQPRADGLPG